MHRKAVRGEDSVGHRGKWRAEKNERSGLDMGKIMEGPDKEDKELRDRDLRGQSEQQERKGQRTTSLGVSPLLFQPLFLFNSGPKVPPPPRPEKMMITFL